MGVYLGSDRVGFNSIKLKEQNYPWLGADAEWVDKYEWSGTLANDTSYSSWTPSTTASEISTSANNVYTFNVADADYPEYYFLGVWDNHFSYTTTPILAPTHFVRVQLYYIYTYASNYAYIISGEYSSTSSSTQGNSYLEYYDSSGVLKGTSNTYSPAYNTTAVSCTTSTVGTLRTVNLSRPELKAQCSSSYFTTDMAAAVDTVNSTLHYRLDIFKAHQPNFFGQMYRFITQLLNNNYDPTITG